MTLMSLYTEASDKLQKFNLLSVVHIHLVYIVMHLSIEWKLQN